MGVGEEMVEDGGLRADDSEGDTSKVGIMIANGSDKDMILMVDTIAKIDETELIGSVAFV